MNEREIEIYMKLNAHYFFEEDINLIREELSILNDDEATTVRGVFLSEPKLALLASILGGFWGADRAMVGDRLSAFLKFMTAGGFFVWWVIDWFLIEDAAKNRNRECILAVRQKNISDKKED